MKLVWIAIPLALVLAALMLRPPAAPIAVSTAPASASVAHARGRRPAPGPSGRMVVYVVGAVARPGLYTLAPGDRVARAVDDAGGFGAQADPAGVNLAAHVNDGDEIEVPLRGEAPTRAVRTKLMRGSHSARGKAAPAIVAINTATATQLATVPGIGPTLAARIVDVRTQEGQYTTFDQLLDVAGMTQARLDRAQPYLRL